MIITAIDTFALRMPFSAGGPTEAGAWGGQGMQTVDSLLVRITTDAGLVGWGESFGMMSVHATKAAIDSMIAPLCLGQNAENFGPLMLDIQQKLHVYGRGGPVMYGVSGIDIALWDLAGKAANMPVYRLLGGIRREQLPCYASLIRYTDPALVRANVRRAVDAGFRAIKLHEIALPAIRAAREEAGPDFDIALDVNCPWSLNEARRMVDPLEAIVPLWLEEPIWPPEDFAGLAALRCVSDIPIAAGENVSTLVEFEHMLAAEAVDYLQPSPAKMGGISALRKVFALAEARGVTVMVHTFYDGPGLLAAIHATAALGGAEAMVEWRFFDLEAPLYGHALVPTKGRIAVPQGPGLGLEPDPQVLARYGLQ